MSGFKNEGFDENGDRVVMDTPEEERWKEVRAYRLGMLEQSDLWMMPDRYGSLTAEQQTEINTFRQALRDITNQDIEDVADNFPTKPTWMT